jgi:4-hydroxybenzoyl-CoA reductase subunit alpha
MTAPVGTRPAGRPTPLVNGIDKVTGKALFTADLPHAHALVGRILRATHAHARILRVDVSLARALPGVAAVVTGADCSQSLGVEPIPTNEYPLAREHIRYRGEAVAAVAAVDEATAAAALDLIRMEVEELPTQFERADTLAEGAVVLHKSVPGNIERDSHHEFGDVAAGFAAADLVREETYVNAEIAQVPMEPHAALATYDPVADQLTLSSATQVPYFGRLTAARCLGMDVARVRVVTPFVGGGFGARTEPLNVEIIACLLARAGGGAVRMVLDREETFVTHRGRARTETRVKLGMTRDGRLTACTCEVHQIGGAYVGYGVPCVRHAGASLDALYRIPAVRYDAYRVYTNTPPFGAMRGQGTVEVRHAFDCLLDTMAMELGLDSFAVRRANLLEAPAQTIGGVVVNSYGLPECLDWVEEASEWRNRKGAMAPGKGLGMACSHYISGPAKPSFAGEPNAIVALKLDFDGSISILTGALDIGQGSSTVIVQTVADVLRVDIARLRLVDLDSTVTPRDEGTCYSRVTFMVCNAAIIAAENLKSVLVAAAARRLDADAGDIEWDGTVFRVAGDQDGGLPFAEVCTEALNATGTLTVKGVFAVPDSYPKGRFKGASVLPSLGFSYAACVVEVSVDPDTFLVTVDKVWAAHDCGFAINPLAVEGQIQGSVWMGMGQALSEGNRYHQGLPLTAGIMGYGVPTIAESPPIEVKIVESMDPNGPFGAKEAGEGSLAGFLSALANAIEDAVGVRLTELPMTPDRIMDALVAKQHKGGAR